MIIVTEIQNTVPGHTRTSPLNLDTLSREPSITEGAASNILPKEKFNTTTTHLLSFVSHLSPSNI